MSPVKHVLFVVVELYFVFSLLYVKFYRYTLKQCQEEDSINCHIINNTHVYICKNNDHLLVHFLRNVLMISRFSIALVLPLGCTSSWFMCVHCIFDNDIADRRRSVSNDMCMYYQL